MGIKMRKLLIKYSKVWNANLGFRWEVLFSTDSLWLGLHISRPRQDKRLPKKALRFNRTIYCLNLLPMLTIKTQVLRRVNAK